MAMIAQEKIKPYLTDLGERLKQVNEDLAGIINSEAEYLSIKAKNGMFSELFVGTSGFPSAPSLKADIKKIYEASKKYDRKAKGIVEKLKKGDVNRQDKLDLKIGTIYVPTDVLEGFLQPTIQQVNDEYSMFAVRNIEEKKDGWFYLTEQKKKLKKATEVENVGIAVIENWDELATMGLAGFGTGLLGPLALLAYPAWMVLKFSKNDRKKHYFFKDMYSVIKGAIKRHKTVSEKKVRANPDESRKLQFRFFHPLIDEELSDPVLVYKTESGEVGVVGGYSDLEEEVKRGVDANNKLLKGLGLLTAIGSAPYELKIPNLKHRTEVSKVVDVLETTTNVPRMELYELNEKQIDEIAKIVKEDLGQAQVVKPSQAFVDKYGSLYPALPFWIGGGEDAKALKAFHELFIEYLTGEPNVPLTTFTKKTDVVNKALKNVKGIPPMYVFVHRDQLNLKDPEKVYEKLAPFSDGTDSGALAVKKRLGKRVEILSKKPHVKNLFDQPSIIELNHAGPVYQGFLKGLHTLNSTINAKIEELDRGIREKDGKKKFSQAQIQYRTNKITELQGELTQKYGKPSPEAINDINEEIYSISSDDKAFLRDLKDKLREATEQK